MTVHWPLEGDVATFNTTRLTTYLCVYCSEIEIVRIKQPVNTWDL